MNKVEPPPCLGWISCTTQCHKKNGQGIFGVINGKGGSIVQFIASTNVMTHRSDSVGPPGNPVSQWH